MSKFPKNQTINIDMIRITLIAIITATVLGAKNSLEGTESSWSKGLLLVFSSAYMQLSIGVLLFYLLILGIKYSSYKGYNAKVDSLIFDLYITLSLILFSNTVIMIFGLYLADTYKLMPLFYISIILSAVFNMTVGGLMFRKTKLIGKLFKKKTP